MAGYHLSLQRTERSHRQRCRQRTCRDHLLGEGEGLGADYPRAVGARQQAALDQGYVAMLRELGWQRKPKLVPRFAEYLAQWEAAGGGDVGA